MLGKRTYVGVVTRPCLTCAEPVTRKNSAFRANVFCSRECYTGSDIHKAANAARNAKLYPDNRVESQCTYCGTHVNRPRSQATAARAFCSVACKRSFAVANPTRKLNSRGYIMVWVGIGQPGAEASGNMLEHRKVMQGILGRPLVVEENVHHINGVRTDNRPENLELWSHAQPRGQRVEDKIQWARNFIALYENTPM